MFNDPFLTKQLIAYIGNKRTLLPFLYNVFNTLELGSNTRFSDPFAGTGAVSRLAKRSGFQVFSNDWEYYSFIVNSCYIGVNQSDSDRLFSDKGGIKGAFSLFKDLKNEYLPYISRHYSPKFTDSADYHTERLFYTRENGEFIDRARTLIEEFYPGQELEERQHMEKSILLASLLYEVSTHANTSGVFKACHKGFGGHGKDALGRILAPMGMEIPHLINSQFKNSVSQMDAGEFVRGITTDICYLDPPYNTHQYGSNYFMLNTVALWDRPDVNQERGDDGRFLEKAGIRKDWVKTKSPYCYKKQAPESFKNLLNDIDSRYTILSYNTEGIIPFDYLYDVMEEHGRVNLHIKDYVLYRGGKQSLARKNNNMELLLVVDRKKRPEVKDRKKVERFLKERRVLNQLRGSFHPGRLKESFYFNKGKCYLHDKLEPIESFKGYKFATQPGDLNCLDEVDLENIESRLSRAHCLDNHDETLVLIDLIEKENDPKVIKKLQKRVLVVYKKLAFKKYREFFYSVSKTLDKKIDLENFKDLKSGINEIKDIAKMRFKG